MKEEDILQSLEELFRCQEVELRYEKGDFMGGFYRYKDKSQVVINKDLNMQQKINLLARELRLNLDLDTLYLVPALREVVENASSVG